MAVVIVKSVPPMRLASQCFKTIAPLALLLTCLAVASEAVTSSRSGRQLLVNGQAFTVQGVNYSPIPLGYTAELSGPNCIGPYHWWQDRPTYVADFPHIRRLGANTIRTF